MQSYSPYQFAAARILTGTLAIYIGLLGLYRAGTPPELFFAAVPWALVLAGLCLIAGRLRRFVALLAPFLTYVLMIPLDPTGLLLLAGVCAPFALMLLSPPGEALRLKASQKNQAWRMPLPLDLAALLAAVALATALLIVSAPAPLQAFAWSAVGILAFAGMNLAWLLPPRPRLEMRAAESSQPIVFFDGVCGLCNTAVDFILAEDRTGLLRYAPLQGETAGRMLPATMTADMDSMVFRDARGVLHTRSEAILRIGLQMGGLWSLGAPALLIPRNVRDALYNTIARNRYRWFGKKDSCRMPSAKERKLFLM